MNKRCPFPPFAMSMGKSSLTYLADLFDECFLGTTSYTRHAYNTLTVGTMSRTWYGYMRLLWSLYGKKRQWDKALPIDIKAAYKLFDSLYEQNHPSIVPIQKNYRIPPSVHQIWLGTPFPQQYRKWQATWQSMPGWSYRLWTEDDVPGLSLYNQDLYDKARNWGERADIIRYEILYRYGGLYVDIDFVCLQPMLLDQFHKQYDFYGAFQPLDIMMFCLANGIIGSRAEHPLLKVTIESLVNSARQTELPVWSRTGPVPFTQSVCNYQDLFTNKNIMFPASYFFPRTLLDERIEQAWPAESVAVHHWAASWNSAKAQVR